MNTRIRLVYVPGNQLRLETFCHKASLSLIVGELLQEGISATVLDLGAAAAVSGMFPGTTGMPSSNELMGWSSWLRRPWGGVPIQPRVSFPDDVEPHVLSAHARAILAVSPAVIGYLIETPSEYQAVKLVSEQVRLLAPDAHQTILGLHAARYGKYMLNDAPALDTAIVGAPTPVLAQLTEHPHEPGCWSKIQGLVYRDRDGALHVGAASRSKGAINAHLPCFPISFRYECFTGQFAAYPVSRMSDLESASRHPLVWADRAHEALLFLNERYQARVFHLDASHASYRALARFAETLLSHEFVVLYSLGGLTTAFDSVLAELLFASGCRAAGFSIHTGSQRLLEEFFDRKLSVSELRATLRACRTAGLFTVAHLSYPCPQDDYHTRAETELFLEACRPEGVFVHPLEVTPQSAWYRRASEYGLAMDHATYAQWALGRNDAAARLPYRMHAWKPRRIQHEQESLETFARQLGCVVGVTEQAGLLARLARNAMEERLFLEQLKRALHACDMTRLEQLMDYVNPVAQQLAIRPVRIADIAIAKG